jgi:hypothetical protein
MMAMHSKPTGPSQRRAYWQAMVSAWSKSGLRQTEFCRRQKISVAAFGWWKARLMRSAKGFVEVQVTEARVPGRREWPYEVVLSNGRSVRMGLAFDDEALGRLIRVAEQTRC